MLTITLDRASLDLDPLIITGSRATTPSGIWVPEGGLQQLPSPEPRRTYPPESAYVSRRRALAVVLDGTDLIFVARLQGTDEDPLTARHAELEAAVSQYFYPVTVDVDGVAMSGEGECTWPTWTVRTSHDRLYDRDRCQVVIPVRSP